MANKKINKNFLKLDDYEALKDLQNFPETEKIVSRLLLWKFPKNILSVVIKSPSDEIKKLSDWKFRMKIEEEISHDTGTDMTEFGIFFQRMKTGRNIHLSYLDEDNPDLDDKSMKISNGKDEESDWILTAYSYKNHDKIRSKLECIDGISECVKINEGLKR